MRPLKRSSTRPAKRAADAAVIAALGLAPVWAYAYAIDPPQPESRLAAVRALLQREQSEARAGARTWEGRLVHEPTVTHILVVADSPAQDLEANQRLEAELRALSLDFQMTAPLEVERVPTRPPALPPSD